MLVHVTDPGPRTLSPGLAGPSLFLPMLLRQVLLLGYGVNIWVAGSPAIVTLAGRCFAFWWALVFTLATAAALVGTMVSARREVPGLEQAGLLLQTAMLLGLAAGTAWSALHGRGIGWVGVWQPLALASMGAWRVQNIARSWVAR